LCVPARLSFTAGKYCSRVGAWSNNCKLPSADYPSLPRLLDASGYESFLGGKMHYDANLRYGFNELYPAWTNQYDKTGKGSRRSPTNEGIGAKSWKNRSSNFHTGETSEVMKHDLEVTQHCGEFLSNRRADDKPFFLMAGYLAPHFPLIVPEKYYKPYKDKVAMPSIPEGHLESLPLNYKHLRRGFGTVLSTPEQVKIGRELYWGFTHWFDDQLGQLLEALRRSEVGENTIVIYLSDHGENKGDHGLWWKNCMYEASARIPLIVHWPKRWKGCQRRSGACSSVDVVQTIAQLAGAETPEDWDGRPLVDVLNDANAPQPDIAVSEYYAHNIASGFTMLRSGRYKYVYHTIMDDRHGPQRELYDLKADPGEFVNLAGVPERQSLIETMHQAMLREVRRDPDETEQICRHDYAKGYS